MYVVKNQTRGINVTDFASGDDAPTRPAPPVREFSASKNIPMVPPTTTTITTTIAATAIFAQFGSLRLLVVSEPKNEILKRRRFEDVVETIRDATE